MTTTKQTNDTARPPTSYLHFSHGERRRSSDNDGGNDRHPSPGVIKGVLIRSYEREPLAAAARAMFDHHESGVSYHPSREAATAKARAARLLSPQLNDGSLQ